MAHLNVTNIVYTGKNPDNFLSPIKFRIAFEIMKPLPGGKPQISFLLTPTQALQWKFIYFGDAKNEEFDQTLDTIHMSKLMQTGQMQFDVAVTITFSNT